MKHYLNFVFRFGLIVIVSNTIAMTNTNNSMSRWPDILKRVSLCLSFSRCFKTYCQMCIPMSCLETVIGDALFIIERTDRR